MYVKSVQAVSMQMKLAQKFDKKVHYKLQKLSYKTWANS
jgi:hypothetical protein